MRIKVDEDLPKAAAVLLREHGFDTSSVIEQQMGGAQDLVLWQVVQNEQRFLVTADKGFGDIQVVTGYDLRDLAGTVTVATPRGVRIRRGRN